VVFQNGEVSLVNTSSLKSFARTGKKEGYVSGITQLTLCRSVKWSQLAIKREDHTARLLLIQQHKSNYKLYVYTITVDSESNHEINFSFAHTLPNTHGNASLFNAAFDANTNEIACFCKVIRLLCLIDVGNDGTLEAYQAGPEISNIKKQMWERKLGCYKIPSSGSKVGYYRVSNGTFFI
jgi:hypothetical protein